MGMASEARMRGVDWRPAKIVWDEGGAVAVPVRAKALAVSSKARITFNMAKSIYVCVLWQARCVRIQRIVS